MDHTVVHENIVECKCVRKYTILISQKLQFVLLISCLLLLDDIDPTASSEY